MFKSKIFLLNIMILHILSNVLLFGCGKKSQNFHGHDVENTQLGDGLILADHNGEIRTLSDFSGQIVVVFFGFTKCSDICPNALTKLSKTLENLSKDGLDQQVQVLFISVDTDRDNRESLKEYVTAFHPRFLGLLGEAEEIQKTASLFKAYYLKKINNMEEKEYDIDHTSTFYLFNRYGKIKILLSNDSSIEDLSHDIRLLLASQS